MSRNEILALAWSMLRKLDKNADQLELRIVWKGCQWSSLDGTTDELTEMESSQADIPAIEIIPMEV